MRRFLQVVLFTALMATLAYYAAYIQQADTADPRCAFLKSWEPVHYLRGHSSRDDVTVCERIPP